MTHLDEIKIGHLVTHKTMLGIGPGEVIAVYGDAVKVRWTNTAARNGGKPAHEWWVAASAVRRSPGEQPPPAKEG